MAPATIIECIEEDLPELTILKREYEDRSKSTGSTTRAMKAPFVFLHSPIKTFEDIAETSLNSEHVKEWDIYHTKSRTAMSQLELSSESDVAFMSADYITGPITEILYSFFSNNWTMRHEDGGKAKRDEDIGIAKGGEETAAKSATVRYDLVFCKPNKGNETGDVIAIIEFKRLGLIRYRDFEDAIVVQSSSSEAIEKKKVIRTSKGGLKGNGLAFTKQVAAYASVSNCKHAALFDWANMILFEFNEMSSAKASLKANVRTVGEAAKISWVHEAKPVEGKKSSPTIQELGKIRKVMLGWLLNAFEDAKVQRAG
ncbi:hypothetical protein J1614_003310 [Plenodomus biglobosus]|nr:hypothetical protein J1614_003310 [Plenodomus biglobosus]